MFQTSLVIGPPPRGDQIGATLSRRPDSRLSRTWKGLPCGYLGDGLGVCEHVGCAGTLAYGPAGCRSTCIASHVSGALKSRWHTPHADAIMDDTLTGFL